ncbi:MAG TPA: alpha/beta hydrolase-fold protein, partial [Planctomycetota bacterium]|nr:alpha/beta hydrolase-fold protein [Planctomycetota bacterium]
MYSASRSPSGVSLQLDVAGDGNATITSGTGAFISIAIDSTFQNVFEMGPSFDPTYPGGGGLDMFAAWLLEELMPEIDRTYRTNGTNGVLGTGLQGLAAFRLGWDHPDRIQIVAAMSPLMTWNNEETVGIVAKTTPAPNLKIWLDVGTNEGKNPQAQLQSVRDVNAALKGIGFPVQNMSYDEVVGGTADEGAWQSRLPNVLSFLFP